MENLIQNIEDVQQKIGYWFDNVDLLLQAFTRSSYSSQFGGENNEVLGFLGDKILDFYVVKIIADRFGFVKSQSDGYDDSVDNEFCIVAHKREADFTELKREIVSHTSLAKRIDELVLADYLFLGESDISNHVESEEKVKADLFKAILGAIAIDSDWNSEVLESAVDYMLDIDGFLDEVETEEYIPENIDEENAVNLLKELSDHRWCSLPEYDIPEDPSYHEEGQVWSCTCKVKSWNIQKTAFASSKKGAKRNAAYMVLCEKYLK